LISLKKEVVKLPQGSQLRFVVSGFNPFFHL
jgi:hypothetical protein